MPAPSEAEGGSVALQADVALERIKFILQGFMAVGMV